MGGMDQIDLGQDWGRWWALVNVVMDEFHKMKGLS